MFVSIYYKPSLFNAHTMISIVHIFMNVNKLCLNQQVCELALKQGFVKEFDAGVKSPFAHKGRLWISYDDDTSLRYKVRAKQTAANNVTSCLVRTQTPSTVLQHPSFNHCRI